MSASEPAPAPGSRGVKGGSDGGGRRRRTQGPTEEAPAGAGERACVGGFPGPLPEREREKSRARRQPQGEARGQRRGEEGGGEDRRREASHAGRGGRSARGGPGRALGASRAAHRGPGGRSRALPSRRLQKHLASRPRGDRGGGPGPGQAFQRSRETTAVPAAADLRAPPRGPAVVVITVPWWRSSALARRSPGLVVTVTQPPPSLCSHGLGGGRGRSGAVGGPGRRHRSRRRQSPRRSQLWPSREAIEELREGRRGAAHTQPSARAKSGRQGRREERRERRGESGHFPEAPPDRAARRRRGPSGPGSLAAAARRRPVFGRAGGGRGTGRAAPPCCLEGGRDGT